jgi:hypothetical protein
LHVKFSTKFDLWLVENLCRKYIYIYIYTLESLIKRFIYPISKLFILKTGDTTWTLIWKVHLMLNIQIDANNVEGVYDKLCIHTHTSCIHCIR